MNGRSRGEAIGDHPPFQMESNHVVERNDRLEECEVSRQIKDTFEADISVRSLPRTKSVAALS